MSTTLVLYIHHKCKARRETALQLSCNHVRIGMRASSPSHCVASPHLTLYLYILYLSTHEGIMISQPCTRIIISHHVVRYKSSKAKGNPVPAPVQAEVAALKVKQHASPAAKTPALHVQAAVLKANPETLIAKPSILNVKSALVKPTPAAVETKPTATTTKPISQLPVSPYRPPTAPPPPVNSAPQRTIIAPYQIVNFDEQGQLRVYYPIPGTACHDARSTRVVGLVYMVQPGDTQFFRLSDGRTLSYAQYGRWSGKGPILVCFHGTPGSRVEAGEVRRMLAELQSIRLITIDRPGYGHSTPAPENYAVLDFTKDVEELLDRLGISEFMIYGVSGGGPYALACAYYFPRSRLIATGIMCGFTGAKPSWANPSIRTRHFFYLHAPLSWNIMYYNPKWKAIRNLRVILAATGNEEHVRDLTQHDEKFRQLSVGRCSDSRRLYDQDRWAFGVENIDSNLIHWYHGTHDKNCPYYHAKSTCDRIREDIIRLNPFDGRNHYDVKYNMYTLWKVLVAHWNNSKSRSRR